jgi:hypothetical protein
MHASGHVIYDKWLLHFTSPALAPSLPGRNEKCWKKMRNSIMKSETPSDICIHFNSRFFTFFSSPPPPWLLHCSFFPEKYKSKQNTLISA